MRIHFSVLAAVLLAAACGGPQAPGTDGAAAPAGAPAATAGSPAAPAGNSGTTPAASSGAAAPAVQGMGGRSGQLINPEPSAMVFLYYDLAGIAPPIDTWVEEDSRVKYAPPIDKAAKRVAVRAELEAGLPAVRGVGVIQLTMNSNLSEYDPTYGEFTVGAFAPSSLLSFDALGQKVSLQFGNGRTAQIWKVPPAEAQAIRDKINYLGNVNADVVLRIKGVQPGPGGGTITADVVEYELRNSQNGQTIGRVQVAP
jgi:hypothetical protein